MKTILITALICVCAFSQTTRSTLRQMQAQPVTVASALVLLPSANGDYVVATLDANAFVVDLTNPNAPVIRAAPSATRREVFNESSTLTAAITTLTLQAANPASALSAVCLYRNGVRLTPGKDYTIPATGNVLTFLRDSPVRAGDTPQAGDTLTVDYRY